MVLETKRLTLIPLDSEQLSQYLHTDGAFEREIGIKARKTSPNERVKTAIQNKVLPAMLATPDAYLYFTVWVMVVKGPNEIVAAACFKGIPNEAAEIELGYETLKGFHNQGYMTEAIGGMLQWAFKQENVKAIDANTAPDNLASQRVLEKNNFTKISQTQDNICWSLLKPV